MLTLSEVERYVYRASITRRSVWIAWRQFSVELQHALGNIPMRFGGILNEVTGIHAMEIRIIDSLFADRYEEMKYDDRYQK